MMRTMKNAALTGKPRREKGESLLVDTSYDIVITLQLNSIFEPLLAP